MSSRAAIIADLKSKKVRGSLSKMPKSKLLELQRSLERNVLDGGSVLELTAGSAVTRPPQGGISLAPLPGEQLGSGHSKPTQKKRNNKHSYRKFVSDNLSKHNGDMKAVAAAYRGGGGGDAHDKFMKATHSYCGAQKGSGHTSIAHYMTGGGHWKTNQFHGGNWWHDLEHTGVDALSYAAEGAADVAGTAAATAMGNPELAPAIAVGTDALRSSLQDWAHKAIGN